MIVFLYRLLSLSHDPILYSCIHSVNKDTNKMSFSAQIFPSYWRMMNSASRRPFYERQESQVEFKKAWYHALTYVHWSYSCLQQHFFEWDMNSGLSVFFVDTERKECCRTKKRNKRISWWKRCTIRNLWSPDGGDFVFWSLGSLCHVIF
jgi:hypothetical protein